RGLAAWRDADRLIAQAAEFRPEVVSCSPEVAALVRPHLPAGTRLATGQEGAKEVATLEVDTVVAAIPGMAGLEPTAAALAAGRHVALANKEAMVVSGPLMRGLAAAAGARTSPASPHQARWHRNWWGGPRLTGGAASRFNRGREVLEAQVGFGVPLEPIEVVVHAGALVHGLVRFRDGSVKAQVGPHDMRLPSM